MRQAKVYHKGEEAGLLIQHDDGKFTFRYTEEWCLHQNKPAISLTLPKEKKEFHSSHLFPFFFDILPEGVNREVLCFERKLDYDDYFGQLLTVATYDTIGAVTLEKITMND